MITLITVLSSMQPIERCTWRYINHRLNNRSQENDCRRGKCLVSFYTKNSKKIVNFIMGTESRIQRKNPKFVYHARHSLQLNQKGEKWNKPYT